MRLGNGLGLRGSALPQIDRCEDDHRHSEEFALPVLKRLEPKLLGAEVLQRRHRLAAVRQLLLAVLLGTADRMQHYGQEEQEKEQRRQ